MYLLGKLPLQLSQLRRIHITSLLERGGDFLVDFGVLEFLQAFAAVLVVQGHGGLVLDCTLEVIDAHIAAEGSRCDVVVLQQRGAGETDAARRGQQVNQVIGKDAVLGPVGLVAHHDDVVVGVDGVGLGGGVVELLNEREDERGVALELIDEVLGTLRHEFLGFGLAQQAAVLKGLADLLVQLVAVGEHDDGGRAFKFAPDLLRQEQHRVALAAALRVPEYAQFALGDFAVAVFLHGLVHAQVLVVAGEDFDGRAATVVIEDEILEQVEENLFLADAAQHGGQLDVARILLFKAFPLVEEFPLGADGAHACLIPVTEHHHGVVVEQLRDGVEVIAVVLVEGVLDGDVMIFQFHKQQRQTVDKAHDVGTALVERTLHPQFPHAQEVVLLGRGKVDDLGAYFLGLAAGLDARHGHTVTDVLVLLLVDLHQRLAAHVLRHALDGLGDLLAGHPWIQRLQGLGKAPRQQHLLVTRAPQGAVQP